MGTSIKDNVAYKYSQSVAKGQLHDVDGEKTAAPRYVIKQCREFLRIADGQDENWHISERKLNQVAMITRLLIMPKGLKAGQTFYTCMQPYQWLLIVAAICAVDRNDEARRKYQRIVLEIGRKNFKTYTIAAIFIILFLTEPPFSKFYSVAPDGSLSREVREAIAETIKASPMLYEYKRVKRFKILRDYIEFMPTETKYYPLNYSNSRFDGKLPNAYLADEVGALPNAYAIEAMSSGQLNIKNKLGCIISTKYPRADNPFESEVAYAKRVLDGEVEDETVFALLYEPDSTKDWINDDEILRQANPVALNSREIWEDLLSKRRRAIEMPSARENFLCKHCNIIYQGITAETYIPIEALQKCRVDHINWEGRTVYIGVDLSQTTDNTGIAMIGADEDGNILCKTMGFLPEGKLEEKASLEKVDYRLYADFGYCIPCGDLTIDYGAVESYVFSLEDKYKVKIAGIGYDRFNALSSAQKWAEKYDCVEVRQHSDTLHMPMKLLLEHILDGKFRYERDELFEINVQNARVRYDATLRMILDKKRSTGKIDLLAAVIDAVYLAQRDQLFNQAAILNAIDAFLEE